MSGGKKELKNKIQQQQPQKHRWEGTGWWLHSPSKTSSHTRVTVTSLQIAMDTNTLPQHYSLLHKRTLTESGSRLGTSGGGRREEPGLFKAKSVPARGGLCRLPLPARRPALVSWVWAAAWHCGVGKDSRRAGRHECHTLGDSKPVRVAEAAMSCAYCVDI